MPWYSFWMSSNWGLSSVNISSKYLFHFWGVIGETMSFVRPLFILLWSLQLSVLFLSPLYVLSLKHVFSHWLFFFIHIFFLTLLCNSLYFILSSLLFELKYMWYLFLVYSFISCSTCSSHQYSFFWFSTFFFITQCNFYRWVYAPLYIFIFSFYSSSGFCYGVYICIVFLYFHVRGCWLFSFVISSFFWTCPVLLLFLLVLLFILILILLSLNPPNMYRDINQAHKVT